MAPNERRATGPGGALPGLGERCARGVDPDEIEVPNGDLFEEE